MLKLAKETGWGYTRILGELKKLGIGSVGRTTVVTILREAGLDPGTTRGEGSWYEILKVMPARSGRATPDEEGLDYL